MVMQDNIIYNIIDLAYFVVNNIYNKAEIPQYHNLYLRIFQNAYKKNADQGVIDAFKDMWGSNIYCVGRGRYVFNEIYRICVE